MKSSFMLTKPTIKLLAKRPDVAIAAHIGSLIAAFIILLLSINALFQVAIIAAIVGLVVTGVVVIVELDLYRIPQLHEALHRGITWIILAIFVIYSGIIGTLALAISGGCYIYYHYE